METRLFFVSDIRATSEELAYVSNKSDEAISYINNENVNESSVHELELLCSALREVDLEKTDSRTIVMRWKSNCLKLREAAMNMHTTEPKTVHKELKVQTLQAM